MQDLSLHMARYLDGCIGPIGADFRTDFADAVTMEAAAVTACFRCCFQDAPLQVNVVYISWNQGIDTGHLA